MGNEYWSLRNIPSRFACYKRTLQTATKIAKQRNAPIIMEHHGDRHASDPTRFHHWVNANGSVAWERDANGAIIDK